MSGRKRSTYRTQKQSASGCVSRQRPSGRKIRNARRLSRTVTDEVYGEGNGRQVKSPREYDVSSMKMIRDGWRVRTILAKFRDCRKTPRITLQAHYRPAARPFVAVR